MFKLIVLQSLISSQSLMILAGGATISACFYKEIISLLFQLLVKKKFECEPNVNGCNAQGWDYETISNIETPTGGYKTGQWYKLKIFHKGGAMTLTLIDEENPNTLYKVTANDTDYASGTVGVRTDYMKVNFDWWRVD